MDRLLRFLLETFIRRGPFRSPRPEGRSLPSATASGRKVAVRFATRAAEWGILLDPELKFGEAYMDGVFVVEEGTIADVLAIMLGQNTDVPHGPSSKACCAISTAASISSIRGRVHAATSAHHYDLDGRLYSLFLDADRQYSCAYFERPDQSLDDAQLAKKRHLAAKLVLKHKTSPVKICACSISAPAGAGSGSILPSSPAPTSPA